MKGKERNSIGFILIISIHYKTNHYIMAQIKESTTKEERHESCCIETKGRNVGS